MLWFGDNGISHFDGRWKKLKFAFVVVVVFVFKISCC